MLCSTQPRTTLASTLASMWQRLSTLPQMTGLRCAAWLLYTELGTSAARSHIRCDVVVNGTHGTLRHWTLLTLATRIRQARQRTFTVQMGRKAIPCTCGAMSDKVRIDMALFGERALSVDSQSVTHSSASAAASGTEAASAPSVVDASGASDMSESDIVSAADKLAGKRARTPQLPQPPPQSAKRHSAHARECVDAQPGHTSAAHAAAAPAPEPPVIKCTRSGRKVTPPAQRLSTTSQAAAKPLRAAALKLNVARKQCSRNGAIMEQLEGLSKPVAVVYDDAPKRGSTGFDLLVPLEELTVGKRRVRFHPEVQVFSCMYV